MVGEGLTGTGSQVPTAVTPWCTLPSSHTFPLLSGLSKVTLIHSPGSSTREKESGPRTGQVKCIRIKEREQVLWAQEIRESFLEEVALEPSLEG